MVDYKSCTLNDLKALCIGRELLMTDLFQTIHDQDRLIDDQKKEINDHLAYQKKHCSELKATVDE